MPAENTEANESYFAIPDGTTAIASEKYKNNTIIEEVYIPDSVTTIGNNAFAGCSNLKTVRMSASVETIGQNAFKDTALTDIVLPDSLKSIGQGALFGTKLKSITLPFVGGSRNSSHKFFGFIFGASGYAAQNMYIPTTLKSVTLTGGGYAPADHSQCNLAYYHVACGNPEVAPFAFFGCSGLTSITLKSGITEIGNSAFQGCTSLSAIYIPKTVDTVAANAYDYNSPFYLCKAGFVICLEASSVSEYKLNGDNADGKGFGKYWNYLDDGLAATVKYSVTQENFNNNNY